MIVMPDHPETFEGLVSRDCKAIREKMRLNRSSESGFRILQW